MKQGSSASLRPPDRIVGTNDDKRIAGRPACESVALDASVLINFLILNRMDILGRLGRYHFVVLDAVDAEISRPEQRTTLRRSLDQGLLQGDVAAGPEELRVFAQLLGAMGVGEAACVAAAVHRGWLVASDERGAFRRIATDRIGTGGIITTPAILAEAVKADIITLDELEQARQELGRNRFTIPPGTFGPLLVRNHPTTYD